LQIGLNYELPDLTIIYFEKLDKDERKTIKEIKANPKLKHLEIIILSAICSDDGEKFAMDFELPVYNIKSFNNQSLVEIFTKICDKLVAKPRWRYSIKEPPKIKAASLSL
jgi:hypothetical protein